MTTDLVKELDHVLECENEQLVIEGFMDRYDVTQSEANDIFHETKKWLWLASKAQLIGHGGLFIDKPLLIIDEMWHTFILHTRLYYQFCIKNFKEVVHHIPTSRQDKLAAQKARELQPEIEAEKHEAKLRKQYSLIYDELGPDTLVKWYNTMANKYTPEYIKSIRKH